MSQPPSESHTYREIDLNSLQPDPLLVKCMMIVAEPYTQCRGCRTKAKKGALSKPGPRTNEGAEGVEEKELTHSAPLISSQNTELAICASHLFPEPIIHRIYPTENTTVHTALKQRNKSL